VFENRVRRGIFGPKRDEVTGEWRKLHNEELHILYSSQTIIRQMKSMIMRWAVHVARMGKERKLYKVLVGKPEGKRPLGRLGRRWEDGIEMNLRETDREVWIGFNTKLVVYGFYNPTPRPETPYCVSVVFTFAKPVTRDLNAHEVNYRHILKLPRT
jgi:hypothetical protein